MAKKTKKETAAEQSITRPLVLFDFDGTIMDTEIAITASFREIFDRHGKGNEFTQEVADEAADSVPEVIMEKYFTPKRSEKYVKEFLKYQQEHLYDLIQPMKGALELLEWLKENGFKTGVVSSRSQDSLLTMLKNAGMAEYLDVIIGGAGGEKIDLLTTDIFDAADAVKAKNVVYVSDNTVNLTVAKEAGAYTIGYLNYSSEAVAFVEVGLDFMTTEMLMIRRVLEDEPYWMAYELRR